MIRKGTDLGYIEAVNLIRESFPIEMKIPSDTKIGIGVSDRSGAITHAGYANSGTEKVASVDFGRTIFEQFGRGQISFGMVVRVVYHEMVHIKQTFRLIKYSGWSGEGEVSAYTQQYLNTTLPKFNSKKATEKGVIQAQKSKLENSFKSLQKEGNTSSYQKDYDDTIEIMNKLLKK